MPVTLVGTTSSTPSSVKDLGASYPTTKALVRLIENVDSGVGRAAPVTVKVYAYDDGSRTNPALLATLTKDFKSVYIPTGLTRYIGCTVEPAVDPRADSVVLLWETESHA